MTRILSTAVLLLLWLSAPLAAQTRLLRHPDYRQGTIAFDYLGDIWTADESGANLRRLTVHPAADSFPRISPDGKWIAFTSARTGSFKVFAIPAGGGAARQLTFHSDSDWIVGWTPDSTKVLFYTTRHRPGGTRRQMYQVGLTDAVEQILPLGSGDAGTFSPDGRRFAYNPLAPNWWRKHYRGSFASEIWITDLVAHTFRKLGDPEYRGNSIWPMWARDGYIYFVADRLPNEKAIVPGSRDALASVNNIWRRPEAGGPMSQVTRHTDGNLFFPSLSSDGKTIVYEDDFRLWKLDLASGKPTEIRISVTSDGSANPVDTLTIDGTAAGYDLSPSGKRLAIHEHGEIFTVAADVGEFRRVTDSPFRDTDPAWSTDGRWIAFISDRSGRPEIWMADEGGRQLKKLTDIDAEKAEFTWAPDSKSILYAASDKTLRRVDVETAASNVVATNAMGFVDLQFSPDGAWISYTRTDPDYVSRVCIRAAGGGSEHVITRDDFVNTDRSAWTSDGKRLVFRASAGQAADTPQARLFIVSLVKDDRDPLYKGIDAEPAGDPTTEAAAAGSAGNPVGAKREVKKVEVTIDWDGIDRRMRQVSRGEIVSTLAPSPAGKTIAFVAGGDIYTVDEDGGRPVKVTPAPAAPTDSAATARGGPIGSLQFTRDGRTLFFRQGDGVYSMPVGGPPAQGASGPARRKVSFTIRMQIDHRAERAQMFVDAWRTTKYRFYDPAMKGVDWAAARRVYEPLLDSIDDADALSEVVKMMLGELNASHVMFGMAPGAMSRAPRTRHPGFEVEPDPSGYYRVSRVLKRGPADKDFVKLRAGDLLLELDGKPLKVGESYWDRLNQAIGRRYEFLVNSTPVAAGAWRTWVEPTADESTLCYEDWVEGRRAEVDRLSKGEIGYIHIRIMDAPHLKQFQEEFHANRGKKALILDVRNNPGGNIEQQLLALIGQHTYMTLTPRHGIPIGRPFRGFTGPMVMLQNEAAVSNGEMLPEGFRALGLGKLVGTPTPGYVLLTGTYDLLDGSTLSIPHGNVTRLSGESQDNHGVVPDVLVENTPEDLYKGTDPQLLKAVEIAMAQVASGAARR